jgi:hypothetical protein
MLEIRRQAPLTVGCRSAVVVQGAGSLDASRVAPPPSTCVVWLEKVHAYLPWLGAMCDGLLQVLLRCHWTMRLQAWQFPFLI